MIDEPALQPAAPGPDVDLDAVLLHVGAGGQDQPALGDGAGRPALAAVVEPAPVRRLAALHPALAERGVDEGLHRLVAAGARREEGAHHRLEPDPGRVDLVQVEAGDAPERRPRPPLAAADRGPAQRVRPGGVAGDAVVARRLRPMLAAGALPAHLAPDQHLMRAAARARHPVLPLVALGVGGLDPAQAADRRRRDQHDLAVPEGDRALLREVDRVALGAGAERIAVDLVAEQDADRPAGEPRGRVGADDGQVPAREALVQDLVRAVARLRVGDLARRGRACRAPSARSGPSTRPRRRARSA